MVFDNNSGRIFKTRRSMAFLASKTILDCIEKMNYILLVKKIKIQFLSEYANAHTTRFCFVKAFQKSHHILKLNKVECESEGPLHLMDKHHHSKEQIWEKISQKKNQFVCVRASLHLRRIEFVI